MTESADAPADDVERLRAELARAAEHSAQLEQALASSRGIGVAIGILMERYKLTDESAFATLRRLSMERNEKLRDVAGRIVSTGGLLPPRLPGQGSAD